MVILWHAMLDVIVQGELSLHRGANWPVRHTGTCVQPQVTATALLIPFELIGLQKSISFGKVVRLSMCLTGRYAVLGSSSG